MAEKRKRRTKVTKVKAIMAIYNARGVLAKAADELGVTRRTLYNYMQRWPDLARAYEDAQERLLDLAENVLVGAMQRGSLPAAMFVLKTKGKDRGYTERQEVKDVTEIEVNITHDEV